MSAGQAAGTHCALSESCVGTTTQRLSCNLGVFALWLGQPGFAEDSFALRPRDRILGLNVSPDQTNDRRAAFVGEKTV
jgi:hypothetical protein